MTTRENTLKQMEQCLNTPDGMAVMDDLREAWDAHNLLGPTPQETAYNVGLRDAYQYLKNIQKGDH